MNTETIDIVNESTKTVLWTPIRLSKFGAFPMVEVWIQDPVSSEHRLSAFQPVIDGPPPAGFNQMDFDFGANVNGFIVIK